MIKVIAIGTRVKVDDFSGTILEAIIGYGNSVKYSVERFTEEGVIGITGVSEEQLEIIKTPKMIEIGFKND